MTDLATLVSLLAPMLLLVVGDRILRWRFSRRRHAISQEPGASASARDVSAPRAPAASAEADVEQATADRQVA